MVVGGYCWTGDSDDSDCPIGKTLKSIEILNLATMTWSDGPDFPYNIAHNDGATSIQDGYLGYSIGGLGEMDGRTFMSKGIMGLESSNGSLRWVPVGNMIRPRLDHTAVKVSLSIIPEC